MTFPTKAHVLMIWLGLLVSGNAVLASEEEAAANEPYPIEYWALRDVVSNVQVSPNGERIAMLKILSKDGDPILHVYDSDNLDNPDPVLINADPMEIRSFEWAYDKEMVLSLRQRIRKKIDGQDDGVFASRITRLDVDKLEFEDFGVVRPAIESLVRNDPIRPRAKPRRVLQPTQSTNNPHPSLLHNIPSPLGIAGQPISMTPQSLLPSLDKRRHSPAIAVLSVHHEQLIFNM